MRETTRAGRSPAEAWESESDGARLGASVLGARLVAAARAAAAMHLAALVEAGERAESGRTDSAEVSA